MADIEWKGIIWSAAFGDLSVKELLTILKGFGPMETLEFEKPGVFRGQMSLSLSDNGTKEITLYYLEVIGTKRKGGGREALKYLKKIFKGELYVEDPGIIRVRNANEESIAFWVKMFQEGYIDALDSEECSLTHQMSEAELNRVKQEIESVHKE